SMTQIVNESKIRDNTPNKDQVDSKPISNRQSDSQRIHNNKGSERFSRISEQGTIAQKQSIDITPTQDKTLTAVDQKNISLQSVQPKNNTPFTFQAKEQSNPPKVMTTQQRLDDQTKIADNKWDKTVQNEVSKGQISVHPKADSYQIDHDQIGTKSPKTIFIAQQPKEPDTKSNKINSRSREMIALDHQESQRAVLSKNLVDYLESQAQLSPQNTSHDPQKVKDRSTQRASQQSGVITGNLVSNIVSEQTKSQPTAITFKQAQVIVRNMVLQIQNSTSEFTQFKQLKKEIPDQLKRSEPIKIETFKLEIAKELKRDSPQIIRQPHMEEFEHTEQLKELLNSKLARRTYENEHTVHVHQQFQKDIDSVITRIEQQRASSNIQTLAETIKEMQNSTIEKATVELSPPTLGKVEIELIKQQDKLMITLKVATDEAKEILEKSSKDLISRLNTLGFKVEHVDVKTAQKTQEDQLQKDQEHDHQQQHKQKRNRQEEVNQDDQRD
ncbi:MAG: flagellar hook-length control protein FliK, partial [Pseudothermotoga sp.]